MLRPGDGAEDAPLQLRVGLLANTFDNLFGIVAGGHVHFIEVAKRWPDCDVTVFAPESARAIITRELPRARFVSMPSGERFIKPRLFRNLYRTVACVRRINAIRGCDIVIATSHFLPDVVPASFKGRRSIVCVQHLLGPPWKRPVSVFANLVSSVFQAASICLFRQFAGAVLVNSSDVAARLRFRQAGRVYVMTHGVEHVNGAEPGALERDAASVLYLGRLVETKGIDDLLRAWALVIRAVPSARLTIAGVGAPRYLEELQRLAARLGVQESVRFCGFVTEEQKKQRLNAASIFAFPSKEEGWGIVLAEAMAHGLPCITYDLPAYRSVFTRGRRWVAVNDVESFARLITELLTNDVLRSELSADALSLSKAFSWEAAAAIEGRAVADVVGDRARGRRS